MLNVLTTIEMTAADIVAAVANPMKDLAGGIFETSMLIDFVRLHAATYASNPYGWEFVAEMDDAEIAEVIGNTSSRNVAINRVRKYVRPMRKLANAENARDAALVAA